MIKAVDIRKGKTILHDGDLYIVHDASHVAKGNKRSYMQVKLKHFKAGNVIDVRFNVDDRIETPFVEEKEFEYLYQEGTGYVVMDTASYEQLTLSADVVGDGKNYLVPNIHVSCQILDGLIISVELPNTVTLQVVDTPPVVKGSTATNQPKEATLETGLRIRVPPFVEIGEKVRVDTRSGEYLDRAK
jgi:elongation factor P